MFDFLSSKSAKRASGTVLELESSTAPKHADVIEIVLGIAAAALLQWAAVASFADFLPEGSTWVFMAACVATMVVHQLAGSGVLRSKPTRRQLIAALGIVVIAVCMFAAMFPLVWGGFAAMANGIIDRFNYIFTCYMPHRAGANYTLQAGLWFLAITGTLVGLASSVLMQTGSKFAFPMFALTLTTIGRYFSLSQSYVPVLMCAFGFLLYYGVQAGSRITLSSAASRSIVPVLFAALLFGVCANYVPSDTVNNAREGFGKAMRELRYGSECLPEGNVASSASMTSGDDVCLFVDAGQIPTNDILLKGYVGANWDGRAWSPESWDTYASDWEGLMPWLNSNGLDPQTQVASYEGLLLEEGQLVGALDLTVTSRDAYRAFVYAPFSLYSADAPYEMNHDAQAVSTWLFGARRYSEKIVDENPERLLGDDVQELLEGDVSNDFANAELVYRGFVRDMYTTISDEDREAAQRLIFSEEWSQEENPSLYTVISRTRLMLSILASYDANATSGVSAGSGTVPADSQRLTVSPRTFMESFLEDDHKGNSSCFATAAVLALRSQGYPARYVEGYRLTPGKFSERGEAYSATATSREIHAWAEVYRDGIGWVPVEATPGFYNELQLSTSVVAVDRNVQSGLQEDDTNDVVTGGVVSEADESSAVQPMSPLRVALMVLVGLVAIVLLAIVLAESQRRFRLKKHIDLMNDQDQQLRVRALFDDIALSAQAAGIPFDMGRPEKCTQQVTQVFPEVFEEEYLRMVELVRKSVFGCKQLKLHEMKTLTSVSERLAGAIPKTDWKRRLVNRYKYLR